MVTRLRFIADSPPADGSETWNYRQWKRLATMLDQLLKALRASVGYGGMRITAPRSAPNIGVDWQTLAPYDSTTVAPYGCAFDVLNGTFTVLVGGVWRISLYTQVLVNNSGTVREAEFRLINADTLDQIGAVFLSEIQGRVLQLSFTGVYDLTGLVGVPIALQVRSDDVLSSVEWQQQNIGLDYAGPLEDERQAG